MKIASQILIGIRTVIIALYTLFIILALVLFLLSGTFFEAEFEGMPAIANNMFIVFFGGFILYGILSTVLGIVAMVKLGKAKSKKDVSIVLGVFIILFNSFIGGILMLCTNDADFEKKSVPAAVSVSAPVSDADRIRQFNELAKSGVITQEEYEAKKKQILEQ